MFRTGKFMSYQRVLEGMNVDFLPDGISMAKSLGGGFPIAAVWIREPYADLLGPGMHGTTFGGTPLACAASLAVLDTIEKEKLADNIRRQGDRLQAELKKHIQSGAENITDVRGYGGMLGMVVRESAPALSKEIAAKGLLVVPAGDGILRLLPPLNVSDAEVDEALSILQSIL
jgi:acetylornithine/N-succinyldiaminopimelate aminotransferase